MQKLQDNNSTFFEILIISFFEANEHVSMSGYVRPYQTKKA